MKILVIGGGGREHALVWKLVNDSSSPEVFCAPGNAGTARIARNIDIASDDVEGLLGWARQNRPDLTVVGPEAPLCAGVTDMFQAEGLRVFGPSRDAARLEGSKLFAKEVMMAGSVPTAACSSFSDAESAMAYVRKHGAPVVIKADGLAAGKGVYVCSTVAEAELAVCEIMIDRTYGGAGDVLLVEECLVGEEASILALIDGEHIVMLASSQDHKRVYNNDEGPNSGGMGAYSPAPIITDDMWPVIRSEVFEKMLKELGNRGITYKGVLYAGLMITSSGPKVLEFNCRFGDPETQAVIPRISGDLLPALQACIDGCLKDEMITWKDEHCVSVVMASGGYPGSYEKGKVVKGLDEAAKLDNVVVFHAGTSLENDKVVTSGGRVLGITALGSDLRGAIKKSYFAISKISFDQAQYRTDIGLKALKKRRNS